LYSLLGCSAKKDLIVPSPESRELIILLPNPDGKTGMIQVTTKGGSQILESPGDSTQVEEISKPPTVPKPLDENKIMSIFGSALSVQPESKGRFASFLLYFESDTNKLTHESRETLSEVVRTIKNLKSNEVYVVGHTDRVGTEKYNIELSSARANFVRDQLVSNGVKSSTFFVSFHGEAMPVVKTEDEVAEPLNRRVEVIYR
jgi:outer membrane protein OmpA-like peptidoglycan-associated protein